VLGGDNQANGAGGALWGFKRMEEPRSSRHRSGRLKLKRHRHRRSRSDSSERDVRSRTRSRSRGADSSLSRLSGAIVEGIDRLLVRSESSRVPKVSTSLVQNVIEPFDPRHHNIEEWLDAVDEFKAIYDWDDRTTSHLALNKLSGPAEVWYRGLPSRVFSWDQWRGKLLATFKIKRNLFDAMREFETLYEYCFQKMALINRLKIPMNGEDQVSLIIGAIQDEHLKFAIEASGITDPNVLAMHFKTLDKKETQSNRTDAPQLRPTFRGKTDSQRPQRLTCFQCGRPGHKRKDCTQTGGETSSRNQRQRAIEYNVNYIGDKPNNKFFKPIELSGCTEICFLDLGSSVSLITKALVDKLGLEPVRVGVPVSLKTLHDSTIPVEYKVTALISIDDIAKEIDLYIVDKCVMGVEILVGQNFTELPEIYYKKQGDSLLFRELSRASQSVEEHRKVNVGTNDPKAIAIVSSVKRFRQYLLGRPFTIITDCAAVRATFSKSEVNPRVGRWVLELNEYNFTIIHRGNQQMRHVDALSRNPPTPEPAVHVVTISEEDWLLAAQQGDKELHRVREILESGEWEDNKNIFRDYALKGGKVCKITNYGLRWVVPKAAKFQILRMAHDDAGHFAFDKTYELISRQYWFPRMRRFIKKYIDNCLNCIYFKTPAGKPQGSLHPIPKIAVPFHTVHIDHVGPFVKSRQGNTEVLVAVDAFTKFVLLYPVKTTRAKHVVRALKDLTKNFGAPHRIISDGAKSFVGKVFTNFCRKRKIHHYVNAPSVPRANGQVERYNRTLLSALATMGADVDDDQWDENIDNIQLGMNGTINRAIGVTPSEALMGIRVSANRMLEPGVDPVVDVTKVREAIAEKTTSYQAAQKLQFDSKRALSRSYSEGDLVMTKIVSHPATGQSKKLLPKWRGPFRITEVLPNERYRVEDIPGARRTKFRYRGVAAVDNLRPWVVFA
jgi:hypothetical protein